MSERGKRKASRGRASFPKQPQQGPQQQLPHAQSSSVDQETRRPGQTVPQPASFVVSNFI